MSPRPHEHRAALERRVDCPKRMVYGPCGGVRSGGRCEVDDRTCPFVLEPAPPWTAIAPLPEDRDGTVTAFADRSPATTPLVVCDARPAEPTLASGREMARLHAGWCDAVLLGEHHDRIDLPNVVVAPTLLAEGCRPWVTVSCRDRNGAALEADLVALAEVGVREVHCVTGDARAPHVRPDTEAVFDLDSLRLTAQARRFGLEVSVAESPTVEPIDVRPGRAADKSRAGASWCFVNLGATPAEVDHFIRRSRANGSTLRHIVCVPVFTDAAGADRLIALPGVGIEPSAIDEVLHATDPRAAGIAHAVASATAHLSIDGVDGIDLSGPASTASPTERATVMREVAEQLRRGSPTPWTGVRRPATQEARTPTPGNQRSVPLPLPRPADAEPPRSMSPMDRSHDDRP